MPLLLVNDSPAPAAYAITHAVDRQAAESLGREMSELAGAGGSFEMRTEWEADDGKRLRPCPRFMRALITPYPPLPGLSRCPRAFPL